jgi:cell division septation protein DedD
MTESSAPPPPPKVVAVVPPPAPQPAGAVTAAPAPAPAAVAVAPPPAGDAWRVAVGTYQDPRAARAVAAQIRGLGYQPQVDSVEKNVAMTRLRLGVFPASAVKEALASAREIAPDAFALRSGDSFTIYAGTFTRPRNLRQVSARLASAGVPVEEEPVTVQRALSRVQLGGFADQADAAEAAARMRQAGIAAEVVAPR